MRRARRERTIGAVGVAPITITQLNCIAALGMNERRYLEWIIEKGVPCKSQGKLRIVEASTALRYLAPDQEAESVTEACSVDDEVDRVLAAVGRKRAR